MSTEEIAQRTWNNAGQLKGPVVGAYFAWRGVAVPETENLRFVASLWHKKSGTSYPAIIARAENVKGVMTGVQRTWLAHGGSGKAPVPKEEQKMSLGVIKGSLVHLAKPIVGAPLLLGEGVETTATAMQGSGWPGWVTLGTSGLSAASLPDNVKDVILLGENDGGKNARAIARAAPDLKQNGVRVRAAYPPEGFKDFNDMVKDAPDRAAAYEAVRRAIEEAQDFVDPLDDLVERSKTDPGAPFEPETLKRLGELHRDDPSRFERLRAQLKNETNCRVTELDKKLNQSSDSGGGFDDMSQADILVALAERDAKLFHTADHVAFADVEVDGHRETWSVGSEGFSGWLMRQYYIKTRGAPGSEAMKQALAVIKAKAYFDGPERDVFTRTASVDGKDGETIYFDLCDAKWRAVEIDAKGWRIVDQTPVRFRRAAGSTATPDPVRGGKIEQLLDFVNLKREGGQYELVIAWLLGALRGKGPYPIMTLHGEQGAAKSFFEMVLRMLVDPNFVPLRSLPRDTRELFIMAKNSHILAFDNVSNIPTWLSDDLCRIASGAGNSVRKLYTDEEEALFKLCRPILINGIVDFVERPDLADRAIPINLDPISKKDRKTEAEVKAALEAARPKIMGALFDAMSVGLKGIGSVSFNELPRMADFAQWAVASTEGLFGRMEFLNAYDTNMAEAIENVLEANPVAQTLRVAMTGFTERKDTATGWLKTFSELAGKRASGSREWPTSPRGLSQQLKRAATYLRAVGIDIEHSRDKDRDRTRRMRVFFLSPKVSENFSSDASAPSSTYDNDDEINDFDADASSDDADANVPADVYESTKSGEKRPHWKMKL